MPNNNEHPRYTDPEHPYSGSGPRYQNNYNPRRIPRRGRPVPVPMVGHRDWLCGMVAAWVYLHRAERGHEER